MGDLAASSAAAQTGSATRTPPEGPAGAPPKSAPPEEFQALYDHIVTCGKCGFCQPTCPIFRATGREGNVARGKVALFRNIVEERTEIGPDTKDAFANCLLCRACTESCFSGVKTDKVVITFRHAYADRFGRGLLQRGVFRLLLPRPRLMRGLVQTIWVMRRTGLPDLARRVGLIGLLNPKLERAMELREGTPGPLLHSRLKGRAQQAPEVSEAATAAAGGATRAAGTATPLVGYWMSCGYNYVLPEVGEATVRVLEGLGNRVEILDNCCCGLAAYGYGDLEAAANLARENVRRLGDPRRFAAIVSECGSCSGHLREYGELLAEDPEWAERAALLTSKVRSFSEFVEERGGLAAASPDAGAVGIGAGRVAVGAGVPAPGAPEREDIVITYHEPCHLGKRYQNVTAQPRQILRSLEGYEFREAAESDACCGAAGTYGVLHPETSAAIIERKTGFIKDTGATVVATECPSCMMQLAYGLKVAGLEVEVVNISQLCDNELRARSGAPAAEGSDAGSQHGGGPEPGADAGAAISDGTEADRPGVER
jgi:glycolate oxidase iron-sulfur subunit